MKHLSSYFKNYPIIPAVRNMNNIEKAMNQSKAVVIFLLAGSIFDLEESMNLAHENDKILMINIDLIKGIANDKKGIEYLAANNLCDGIISTKSYLIKTAHQNGLMTIHRLFLLDSASIISANNMLGAQFFDAVEILPGIAAPYFIDEQDKLKDKYPVIAGGLVNDRKTIDDLVRKGVFAVSTSREELWSY